MGYLCSIFTKFWLTLQSSWRMMGPDPKTLQSTLIFEIEINVGSRFFAFWPCIHKLHKTKKRKITNFYDIRILVHHSGCVSLEYVCLLFQLGWRISVTEATAAETILISNAEIDVVSVAIASLTHIPPPNVTSYCTCPHTKKNHKPKKSPISGYSFGIHKI